MKSCCNHSKKDTKCVRKKDKKEFKLPRRFSKNQCKTPKGYTMESSCSPYKYCQKGGNKKNTNKKNTNMFDKPLKVCSTKPMTGYVRDGYCRSHNEDRGNHLVCARITQEFLDYSKSKGNDLSSVVKENEKWCLCEERWRQAWKEQKAPKVIKSATNNGVKKDIKDLINLQVGGNKKNTNKKTFLYNPNDPKKSFDVYIDKNPNDTINIKYTTIEDVKKTIRKLEKLYKQKKYTHKRIWQVGMIMKVRLEVIKKLHPKAKNIKSRFNLSNRYFTFLGNRTKAKGEARYKMTFMK